MNRFSLSLAVAAMAWAGAACAAGPFQHPAIGAAVAESNPLVASATVALVGHPASPQWKRVHANAAHPADAVASRGAATAPDANHFLVQPPAAVRWALRSEPGLLVAGATR